MGLNLGTLKAIVENTRKIKDNIATLKTSISMLHYGYRATLNDMEVDLLYKADDCLLDAEYTLDELIELMEARI